MLPKLSFLLLTLSFPLLFSFPVAFSAADPPPPPPPSSPSTICESTPHPDYCRSVLPHYRADVHVFGRFSVRRSLSRARKFLSLVDSHLTRGRKHLAEPAVRALEDCRFLAGLTTDYLLTTFNAVNATSRVLPALKAEDVQTFLSATITNEETCLQGLRETTSASGVERGLAGPLSDDSKHYGVSLALFAKGWVPKKKKKSGFSWKPPKNLRSFRNGMLPLKMSKRTRDKYERASRRKLAEGEHEVLVNDIVIVSQDGNGDFTLINDAISAAPNKSAASDGYFLIYVTAGLYQEYVTVPKEKRYLLMVGDGINKTVITGNHSVGDGWSTFNSATFIVSGPNFIAVNLTIQNTAGPAKGQAVALRSGADFSLFYSCSFDAYQDTLYTHSLRQFYRECDIYGTVDFIFGNAAVVLQKCNIYPRQPRQGQSNLVTAQGRSDPNQNTGTSIHGCTIKATPDLATSNYTVNTYLGRPWRDYSRTVVMQSYLDSVIHPDGWQRWSSDEALNTLYYAEYNNTGPGSDTSDRVKWLGFHVINATDASNFTVSNFLLGDDWIPQTGVPYYGGLLS